MAAPLERVTARWTAAETPEITPRLIEEGVDALLAPLLARRGVRSAEEAEAFLAPSPDALHDPFLLSGMEAAVERLLRARDQGETVVIVGDYDVDGVTATALLSAVLRALGLEVETVLPHRLHEGYGFQSAQVQKALELDASVIVTVDCGTTSASAISEAMSAGLDVIVTDHHLPGPDFPSAAVQVNPRLTSCDYPFPELCGAGIALKLAQALGARSGREIPLAPLLRIAALGTVADVVPLVGENRAIAALGIRALGSTSSPGLQALFRVAGVRAPLSSYDIGYRLGPRINAAGRLDSAEAALELLLSRDRVRAEELAQHLDSHNRERQGEERRVVEEAREAVLERSELPGLLMLWSRDWHRGVVGIAAGRLAREFHRPTLLLADDGETATGSGRSVPGISLHAFLSPFAERYRRFGGHDMAVGLTVASHELDPTRQALEEAADWPADLLRPRYEYELSLGVEEVTPELFRRLSVLEPHGEANPRPLVRVGPIELPAAPVDFGDSHVKVRGVPAGGARGGVWLVGWGWRERREDLSGVVEAVGQLTWDDFLDRPQLTLRDVRPASGA